MAIHKKVEDMGGNITPVRTVQREKCLALLITSRPIKYIASELKIKPHTIYKWMQEKDFQEKLQQQLGVIRTATIQATCELIAPAYECIAAAIETGDAKIALALLKEMGALRSGGSGAGFEAADQKGSSLKVVINVSGHADIHGSQDDTHTKAIIDVKPE